MKILGYHHEANMAIDVENVSIICFIIISLVTHILVSESYRMSRPPRNKLHEQHDKAVSECHMMSRPSHKKPYEQYDNTVSEN